MDISELKQKELPSIPDEIKKSIAACNITLMQVFFTVGGWLW